MLSIRSKFIDSSPCQFGIKINSIERPILFIFDKIIELSRHDKNFFFHEGEGNLGEKKKIIKSREISKRVKNVNKTQIRE